MESWHNYSRGVNGVALLLLRGAVTALLLLEAQREVAFSAPSAVTFIVGAIGVGLSLGILTAICGVAAIAGGVMLLFGGHVAASGVGIITLILCGVVSMMGPGAYSLDCVIFGRRRIVL